MGGLFARDGKAHPGYPGYTHLVSKLERLMKLLTVLLDTEQPLTADSIRSRIGGYPENNASFRRSFERDKDDLRNMGIDIAVAAAPGTEPPIDGYIVHAQDYAGKDPGLEPDELAALHLAAALVRVDTLGDDAFWKLGGSEQAGEGSEAVASMPSTDLAGVFHTAIDERRRTTFLYRDLERVLEPSRISFVHGKWYVSGYDQSREAERVFRLDRIVGEVVLGDPGRFEPRPARGPEVIRTWEFGDDEPIETRVRIDASAAMWGRVHLREDEFSTADDGSIELVLSVRNVDGFRDWVLSFLDAATVLSPPEMRAVMFDWLSEFGEPSS